MTPPISILVGEDPFLVERELAKISKDVLSGGIPDFNLEGFSARSASATQILDACNTLPMMSPLRLVIVKEACEIRKEDMETWLFYFSRPSPTTRLVLVAGKIDKRLKLWQKAAQSGWIVELKIPYANQMARWIAREAGFLGLKISQPAATCLADLIGPNPMGQISALEKLKLFVLPRSEIDLKDVTAVVGGFNAGDVFDFVEKVGERNFAGAEDLLLQMSEKGEPPVKLLFMMARHFRLLLLAEEGLRAGLSENKLAQSLGVGPWFAGNYTSQAKKIAPEKLRRIYRRLLSADRALKTSPLNPRLVIDEFLMNICFA